MGAIARGKIFGIKGQPVVKSVYIQVPMNYFLIIPFIVLFNDDTNENHETWYSTNINTCKFKVTHQYFLILA